MHATEPRDATGSSGTAVRQYLTFFLGDEEYGIPILDVQEICGQTPVTPIPNTARHVLGVTNLRGSVVPVLDLRERFGMPAVDETRSGVTIVVTPGSRVVGLAVDAVSDVVNVASEDVSAVPELTVAVDQHFITGMARHDDRLVLLLDVDAVLSGDDLTSSESSPDTEGTAGEQPQAENKE